MAALAREETLHEVRAKPAGSLRLRPSYAPFVWPAVIVVGAVIVFPWAFTIWMSLHEWKVGGAHSFVGLSNYARLATDTRFLDSSGARGLMRAAKQAAAGGVTLHVICPRSNSPVRLVVDLLEMDRLVPIVESPADVTTPVAEQNGRP